LNPVIAQVLQPTNRYAVVSPKIAMSELGPQIAQNLAINYAMTEKKQEPISTISINGLWEMLAVAKWIGDMDCIGGSGGNAGIDFKTNSICKIDAGFFGKELDMPKRFKHIFISPGALICFEEIEQSNLLKFLTKIKEISEFSDQKIYNMCGSDMKNAPKLVQQILTDEITILWAKKLCTSRDTLKELYAKDLLAFG